MNFMVGQESCTHFGVFLVSSAWNQGNPGASPPVRCTVQYRRAMAGIEWCRVPSSVRIPGATGFWGKTGGAANRDSVGFQSNPDMTLFGWEEDGRRPYFE